MLHDVFDLPFGANARVVGRSPEAARQLASRARRHDPRHVAGGTGTARPGIVSLAEAFLAAARSRGHMAGLLAVLAPDVVFRADAAAVAMGGTGEVRGAPGVAAAFRGRAAGARAALVDGHIGLIVAPTGHLRLVLRLSVTAGDRITAIEAIADAEALRQIDLAVLDPAICLECRHSRRHRHTRSLSNPRPSPIGARRLPTCRP